uniref:Rho guanine nucleotide exchange factor (GEF) 7a n=1 Tax=Cyclopterus lumpus TaxID=8103 RepID=A0A8C3AG83_CYCLU
CLCLNLYIIPCCIDTFSCLEVLQNILETETEYSKDLQSLLTNYLRPLQCIDNSSDAALILGNLEEISTFQQMLVQSLEERTKLPESQQRVGGFFLNLMPQMKALYVGYCSNHPSAVSLLTQHSEVLGEFMEGRGAVSPGILPLTTGLSKPFMRLDKYPNLLKELERHMEESHPDRPDIQKCMASFKNLSAQCQEVRKRKELELQILTESIRLWEGDDIKTLGSVLYMSQVLVQSPGSEEKSERYLMLFPHVLLMLSASPRMSGFIFQGKLPLASMTVTKLEDCEAHRNAFELNGTMFDRLQVVCTNQQDLQDWVEHLPRQIKHTASTGPSHKPLTVPCHTDLSKSPKSVKKLLPKRKPERKQSEEEFALRKSTAALEEDAQILKVIEAYCTSAKTRESGLHVIVPGERKILAEDSRRNGQSTVEEKSLVDVVYGLRDEVQELKQDNKKMKRSLEEEQRARKDLEKAVKRVLKSMNDPTWDETNL